MKVLTKIAKMTPFMSKAELEHTRRKGKKFSAKGDAALAGASALLGAAGIYSDELSTPLGAFTLALGGAHARNAIRQHQGKKKYKHLSDSELEKLVKSKHG